MKRVKHLLIFFLTLGLWGLHSCSDKREGPPKLLVFSKTMGFRHTSIPAGIEALQKLASDQGYVLDTTENASNFNEANLEQYSAVIFLNTTGNILNAKEEAAFERYIQAGGGFVGVHAATDTEYDWKWYGRLVGAYFASHPEGLQQADFRIVDKESEANAHFEQEVWNKQDEIYNFRAVPQGVQVLIKVDEDSYEGGTMEGNHPISWTNEYDGGRVFYTALGHTEESYGDPLFLQHLQGGIAFAIGDNKKLNYKKAKSQIPPDADRFSKRVLHEGEFYEPTEMAVLPGGEVLIAQRRGEIISYNPETQALTEVAKLDVYCKSLTNAGVNIEEGLMGLQKDPDYATNHWVYAYYAPTGEESVNRLSRFQYKDGIFDLTSEQRILDVGSDREVCCHTGGSIAFGPDKLLYLSTGDNSTPFDEPDASYVNNGYAPLNDEPGKANYDARRSSGNTNDLRGKILRIKVEEDGSYSIPEGNLFAQGNPKTRPEIYTMGHRNPYRISVDPVNQYVYWGEVGPDAAKDNLTLRGPKGYDELNQAKGPGNFGWPLFIANNQPYVAYDYSNGESGQAFNPKAPKNDSRNNTGLRELPPAQPAMIYYPYDASGDFPQVQDGSRNAMAGPVFYQLLYPNSSSLPSYFDGKLLVYDWMRGWVFTVHFFEDGSFKKMEPFAPHIKVNGLIDMELDENGNLYYLEYGNGWFSQNDDSALSVVDFYGGNRPPVVDDIRLSKSSGLAPFTVKINGKAHDREGDKISYILDFGDGEKRKSEVLPVEYTYNSDGEYQLIIEVVDEQGDSVIETRKIIVGNTMPEVAIEVVEGNSQFALPGRLRYRVILEDAEDSKNEMNAGFVSLDYFESPDEVQQNLGHQELKVEELGERLTQELDCKTCHKAKEASIGPSYTEIAARYANQEGAEKTLMEKISKGGSGSWGQVAMPAHPNLSPADLRQMVVYIQSLSGQKQTEEESLPLAGTIEIEASNRYAVLKASYTDKGAGEIASLSNQAELVLKPAQIGVEELMEVNGFSTMVYNDTPMLLFPPEQGSFDLKKLDLTGVEAIRVVLAWQSELNKGVSMNLRQRTAAGEQFVSSAQLLPNQTKGQPFGILHFELNEAARQIGTDLQWTFENKLGAESMAVQAVILRLELLGEE